MSGRLGADPRAVLVASGYAVGRLGGDLRGALEDDSGRWLLPSLEPDILWLVFGLVFAVVVAARPFSSLKQEEVVSGGPRFQKKP